MSYLNKTAPISKKPLLIKYEDVSVNFGSLEAIKNISFNLYQNDLLYIIGPNGGGKSTLIKTLLGLVKVTNGTYSINRNNISYLPQNTNNNLSIPITVFEVVYSGLNKQKLFISKQERELINQLLIKVEMVEDSNTLFNDLSGGQQQRVLLARALISNPELIILDEPTSALDNEFKNKFNTIIQELKEFGATIIIVTHDLNHNYDENDYILKIDQTLQYFGKIKEEKKNV